MPRLETPGGGGQNRARSGAILCRIFPSPCLQAFWVSWAWQQTQPAESGSWLAPRNQSVVSPFPSSLDFFSAFTKRQFCVCTTKACLPWLHWD